VTQENFIITEGSAALCPEKGRIALEAKLSELRERIEAQQQQLDELRAENSRISGELAAQSGAGGRTERPPAPSRQKAVRALPKKTPPPQ
jgi:chromosome segregation ATPase